MIPKQVSRKSKFNIIETIKLFEYKKANDRY